MTLVTASCTDTPDATDSSRVENRSVNATDTGSIEMSSPTPSAATPVAPTETPPYDAAADATPSDAAAAAVTIAIPFLDGGKMRALVTDVEVTGELLRIAVTFAADLPLEAEEVTIAAVLEGDENASAASIRPELIDPVNLKAYETVVGGTKLGESVPLVDGVPRTLAFYFAAPQERAQTFDLHLSSQAPPITDIPGPQ